MDKFDEVIVCHVVANVTWSCCSQSRKDQLGLLLMLYGLNRTRTPQKIWKQLKEPKNFSLDGNLQIYKT